MYLQIHKNKHFRVLYTAPDNKLITREKQSRPLDCVLHKAYIGLIKGGLRALRTRIKQLAELR